MHDSKPTFARATASTVWGSVKDILIFVMALVAMIVGNVGFYLWDFVALWRTASHHVPALLAQMIEVSTTTAVILPIVGLLLCCVLNAWLLWQNLLQNFIRRVLLLGSDYILPHLEKPLLLALTPFVHGNKIPGSDAIMRAMTHKIPRHLSRVSYWILGNMDIAGLFQQLRSRDAVDHPEILHYHLKHYLDENYLEPDYSLLIIALALNIGFAAGLVYVY